jgi:hypothetical protein
MEGSPRTRPYLTMQAFNHCSLRKDSYPGWPGLGGLPFHFKEFLEHRRQSQRKHHNVKNFQDILNLVAVNL